MTAQKAEDPNEITEHDSDPDNLFLRAGYLYGMAMRTADESDRLFLQRAARSLRAFAVRLRAEKKI